MEVGFSYQLIREPTAFQPYGVYPSSPVSGYGESTAPATGSYNAAG